MYDTPELIKIKGLRYNSRNYIRNSVDQCFETCGPRPVPRKSVDAFCNGYFKIYLFFSLNE